MILKLTSSEGLSIFLVYDSSPLEGSITIPRSKKKISESGVSCAWLLLLANIAINEILEIIWNIVMTLFLFYMLYACYSIVRIYDVLIAPDIEKILKEEKK